MEVEDSGEEEKAGSIASNSAAVATTSSDLFSSAPRMLVHPSAPDAASAAEGECCLAVFAASMPLPRRCDAGAVVLHAKTIIKLDTTFSAVAAVL